MTNNELLTIEPNDLQFVIVLEKQISCSLYLMNKTDNNVAFKVMVTNPKNYCVRPNIGFVLQRSTCEVIVTMQAQKEAPFDMQCKDKFLIQGVKASPEITAKEVTREMFNKEAGHIVDETKLRVTYLCYDTNTITCSSRIRRRFSFTSNTLSDVSCYGVGAACHELERQATSKQRVKLD